MVECTFDSFYGQLQNVCGNNELVTAIIVTRYLHVCTMHIHFIFAPPTTRALIFLFVVNFSNINKQKSNFVSCK